MSRWTVVVAVVSVLGCKEKRKEAKSDPVTKELDPLTELSKREDAVAKVKGNLPPDCIRYGAVIEKVTKCASLPEGTREALKRSYEQSVEAWTSIGSEVSSGTRRAMEEACKAAADGIENIGEICPSANEASRAVPGEKGVPLDQTVLGPMPHPFGALEVLKPGITREEILSALPNARRDGDERITVPLGVEDYVATIDIDFAGKLDVMRVTLHDGAADIVAKAWGKPSADGSWFDRKRRWRADLDEEGELMIGPYTPLAEILGKGPDGLAESKAIIGASPSDLAARFGTRIQEFEVEDDEGNTTGEKRFELLLPATELCRFYTHAELSLTTGHVSKLLIAQCYQGQANRRAALAAMESKWGRVIPARSADDRPVFTFAIPNRKVEVIDDEQADHPGWQISITAK